MATARRMMLFIDGENIVCRYQSMIQKGFVPHQKVTHQTDEFVWSPHINLPGGCEIIRAYYYTSVTGDENKIVSTVDLIKELDLGEVGKNVYGSARKLYPSVFKKPRKAAKAKSIDIQMTVDILSHVYQDNLDIVCLFSGDGDYQAVVNEVIRRGKRIYIAAFSDGLNPALKQLADRVVNLDPYFFDLRKSPQRI